MVSIGEASRRSGVAVETIRYYERAGVVGRPRRAANGRRVYTDDEVAELRFLKRCRGLGFSLADAGALLHLSRPQVRDCDAARATAERHLTRIRARMAELRRLEAALTELSANCAEGRADCPLLDRLRDAPG